MTTTKIFLLLIVLFLFEVSESRAFGQRVEYRYEYDPRKDSEPRVRVKFDDVTDEDELMKIFKKSKNVRKSPSKYSTQSISPHKQRFITSDEIESENENEYIPRRKFRSTGWQNVPYTETQNWHNGFSKFPVHRFIESPDNIAEQMAEFLRKQSEDILSDRFPEIPRDRFSDPPHFHFIHHQHQKSPRYWF
ncbi:unnamed protein product [Caenorhabditis angaria]|uniref:Uncharacterized protein n=1 Tax=Caenorhabditis angaria TaxID=860376 RepID=A0A9P1ITC3_9PELO|nr:unnamed protein product [Caenorhabditis angaria]